MSTDRFILTAAERPGWLEYPASFQRVVLQCLVHMTPWHLLEADRAMRHFQGLATRYPSRELFPFAYRQDNDDVACWARGCGERVFIIHDFAAPGWEDEMAFDDFRAWFRHAVESTIDWEGGAS